MTKKKLPFTKNQMEEIIKTYPTPFHIYDEKGIRERCKELYTSFSWASGFTNYYALKACPNPYILQIVASAGMGVDCSSLTELMLAEKMGITGERIMFTSNNTPAKEYSFARKLGATINLDDLSHIEFLEKTAGLPDIISFRYNPGPTRSGNSLIGNPREAKYGLTKNQLLTAYKVARKKGIHRFGLHTMVVSNELRPAYIIETAEMMFALALEIFRETGIKLEFINLGGGFGIPYNPSQTSLNLSYISSEIKKLYKLKILTNGLGNIKIFMECGRYITGPFGYLVTQVIHKKEIYKNYIGVDACMANLMRPALYGAYHHETVLGKERNRHNYTYDVVGGLCENNDKFAIDRKLPKIDIGDIIVIHDTGAHGYAMGFNYNGKLRSAELLLKENHQVKQIRRAETVADYFTTIDFPNPKKGGKNL